MNDRWRVFQGLMPEDPQTPGQVALKAMPPAWQPQGGRAPGGPAPSPSVPGPPAPSPTAPPQLPAPPMETPPGEERDSIRFHVERLKEAGRVELRGEEVIHPMLYAAVPVMEGAWRAEVGEKTLRLHGDGPVAEIPAADLPRYLGHRLERALRNRLGRFGYGFRYQEGDDAKIIAAVTGRRGSAGPRTGSGATPETQRMGG